MRQVVIEGIRGAEGDLINLFDAEDIVHIRNVLRLSENEKLHVTDGLGQLFETEIITISKHEIILKILSVKAQLAPARQIHLYQGLPKGQKMDSIVQKATELGCTKIIPFTSQYSVAQAGKPERWKKIAKESLKQCGRSVLPEIGRQLTIDEVVSAGGDYDLRIVLYENEEKSTLKSVLAQPVSPPESIAIAVGPEGGFSEKEIKLFISSGWQSASLGSAILRTETAGPAALAMLLYEYEL